MTDREAALKLIKYGVVLICVGILSYAPPVLVIKKEVKQCDQQQEPAT